MTRHIYATFDAEGFPTGYYPDDWHEPRLRPIYGDPVTVPLFEKLTPTVENPNPEPVYVGEVLDPAVTPNPPVIGEEPNPATTIPAEAVEISEAQYADLLAHEGRRRWDGEKVVPYDPPAPPPPPIVISSLTFFDRMTDEEAAALDDAMMAKPVRIRSAWAGVTMQGRDIREDQPLLWDALRAEIAARFGEEKATQWLARPTQAMAATADDVPA